MKLPNLNESLSLLANVAVLLGILLLAVELRQNTSMMEAQTRDSITGKMGEWQMAIATDRELTRLWENGRTLSFSDSDPYAAVASSMLLGTVMRNWENELYQYNKGLYEENEFLPRTTRWKLAFQTYAGFQMVWCSTKESFSLDFRELIDSYLDEVQVSCASYN